MVGVPVLMGVSFDLFLPDYEIVERAITKRMKGIIPVNIDGIMCDCDRIFEVLEEKKSLYTPSTVVEVAFDRFLILIDILMQLLLPIRKRRLGKSLILRYFI